MKSKILLLTLFSLLVVQLMAQRSGLMLKAKASAKGQIALEKNMAAVWPGTITASSRSTQVGEVWNKVASDAIPLGQEVNAIKMVDENIIWMAASPFIFGSPTTELANVFKSVDGGNTWEQLMVADTEGFLAADISPVSDMVAYAVLWKEPFSGSETAQQLLYKTTDGGMTWAQVETYVLDAAYVHFFNENEGWVFGSDPQPRGEISFITMSVTTDGGATWNDAGGNDWLIPEGRSLPPQDENEFVGTFLYSLSSNYAVGDSTIIVGGTNYWISHDRGYSWESLPSPLFEEAGLVHGTVAMKDAQTFMFTSNLDLDFFFEEATAYATTDGGTTWTKGVVPVNPSAAAYLPGTDNDFIITGQDQGFDPAAGYGITGTARTSDLTSWEIVDDKGLLSTDFIGENQGIGAYANYPGVIEAGNVYSWGEKVLLEFDAIVTRNNENPLTIVTLNHLAEDLVFDYQIQNLGANDLTNVMLTMEVVVDGTVISTESAEITIGQNLSDAIAFTYKPTQVGVHEFNITASHSNLGEAFYKDLRLIEISETTLAKDDGVGDLSFSIIPDGEEWTHGYLGSEFNLLVADKLTSFSITVGDGSADSTGLYNFIVKAIGADGVPEEGETYKATGLPILDAFNDFEYVTIQLPEPVELPAGRYIFAVGQDEPQATVNFGYDDKSDPGAWFFSPVGFGGGSFPWTNVSDGSFPTLMLRPIFEKPFCGVAIPEIISLDYSHAWLRWEEKSIIDNYTIRYRQIEGTNGWDTLSNWTSRGIITSRLQPCTEYEYQVAAVCGETESEFSPSRLFKTEGCEDPYCFAYGLSFDNWIEAARFGNQVNTSRQDFGYDNFTALVIDTLDVGVPLEIELTPGTRLEETIDVFWSVWVDLNQDEEFDDFEERLIFQEWDNVTPLVGRLILPSSAAAGPTRLRIAMDTEEARTPCATSGFREVEDYTIVIGDKTTSISEALLAELLPVSLAPNPFSDKVRILIGAKEGIRSIVQVTDLSGKEITSFMANHNEYVEKDLSDLSNGIYLVKVTNGELNRVFKVIKQ